MTRNAQTSLSFCEHDSDTEAPRICNCADDLTLGSAEMASQNQTLLYFSATGMRLDHPDNLYVAELEQLWKDLAACKEENGFISLPEKLKRLFPLAKGKLMVRDCYSKLAHIVEDRAEVRLLGSTQTGDSEMTDVSSPSAGMSVEKGYVGELYSPSSGIP